MKLLYFSLICNAKKHTFYICKVFLSFLYNILFIIKQFSVYSIITDQYKQKIAKIPMPSDIGYIPQNGKIIESIGGEKKKYIIH